MLQPRRRLASNLASRLAERKYAGSAHGASLRSINKTGVFAGETVDKAQRVLVLGTRSATDPSGQRRRQVLLDLGLLGGRRRSYCDAWRVCELIDEAPRLDSHIPVGIVPLGSMLDARDELLRQALVLFADYGYDAVGVQRIVEAAGVTKPTLYHYFGSKRGLLEEVLTREFAPLLHRVAEASRYSGDLVSSLRQVTACLFAYGKSHSAFYRLQLSLWLGPAKSEGVAAVRPFTGKLQELLERFFVEAATSHGNMRRRHRRYAASYLGMVNSYVSWSLNGYVKLGDEHVRDAVHQFMHGILS